MCDYCGCRETASAIDELSAEHELVLDLTYRLRRAARALEHPAALPVVDELEPLLAVHTAKEEEGLFAELRSAWGADGRLDVLTDEHRQADALLTTAREGGPDWPDAAIAAADLLSAHLLAEETDLFPYAMYELRPEQWQTIQEVHERVGRSGHAAASAPTNRARV